MIRKRVLPALAAAAAITLAAGGVASAAPGSSSGSAMPDVGVTGSLGDWHTGSLGADSLGAKAPNMHVTQDGHKVTVKFDKVAGFLPAGDCIASAIPPHLLPTVLSGDLLGTLSKVGFPFVQGPFGIGKSQTLDTGVYAVVGACPVTGGTLAPAIRVITVPSGPLGSIEGPVVGSLDFGSAILDGGTGSL